MVIEDSDVKGGRAEGFSMANIRHIPTINNTKVLVLRMVVVVGGKW